MLYHRQLRRYRLEKIAILWYDIDKMKRKKWKNFHFLFNFDNVITFSLFWTWIFFSTVSNSQSTNTLITAINFPFRHELFSTWCIKHFLFPINLQQVPICKLCAASIIFNKTQLASCIWVASSLGANTSIITGAP